MTMNDKDTVVLDRGIAPPTGNQHKPEQLPNLRLAEMKEGDSIFLATRDEEHRKRRIVAIRSRIRRGERPTSNYRISMTNENDQLGIRVFCISENDEPV